MNTPPSEQLMNPAPTASLHAAFPMSSSRRPLVCLRCRALRAAPTWPHCCHRTQSSYCFLGVGSGSYRGVEASAAQKACIAISSAQSSEAGGGPLRAPERPAARWATLPCSARLAECGTCANMPRTRAAVHRASRACCERQRARARACLTPPERCVGRGALGGGLSL